MTANTQQIIERHDAFMSINYGRFPIAFVRGSGCELWDGEGKRYLDLFAGFGAPVLGHCHPDLVAAITKQAGELWHVGNLFHTEPQTRLAEHIHRCGFGGRSFFCHSGADANEAAIKLARLYGNAKPGPNGQRYGLITATKSFHGRTFATMCATGNPAVRAGFGPMAPGFTNVAYNDVNVIRDAIDDTTVAVLVEPIQGEGGINLPDADYFQQVRDLCDERDLLLIADEVWTGVGRTGEWFGHQLWGIVPDIMTLGKGVGGGLPVGVMCAKPDLAELYNAKTQGGVKHASTLGGNCISMAVSAAIFEVIERDKLIDNARQMGTLVMEQLNVSKRDCAAIADVRGRGLFIGITLDPHAKGVWFNSAAEVVQCCLDRGLVVNGTQGEVIRLAPPLVIGRDALLEGLDILMDVVVNGPKR